MKAKFTSVDIAALLPELNQKLKGLRVNQVYDVDHKTYLIRFNASPGGEAVDDDEVDGTSKVVLILESGSRFHTTSFQWPKSFTPSGFTMKLRKHLKNKRLEHIQQLGADRVVDFQFGSGEAAYHIVLELYDRGNIVITDCEWVILNILRPRKESGEDSDVKFMVREKYPRHLVKSVSDYRIPSRDEIADLIAANKPADTLRKVFVPKLLFGPALIEHSFIEAGLGENAKIRSLDSESGPDVILAAIRTAQKLFAFISTNKVNPGFITQGEERKTLTGLDPNRPEEVNEIVDVDFRDFHPYLFNQLKHLQEGAAEVVGKKVLVKKFSSFDEAVDSFFSSIKGQKLDSRQRQLEKEALMKLERVRLDHEKRLEELSRAQEKDEERAELIIMNSDIVEEALTAIRDALQKRVPWPEIEMMVKEPDQESDAVRRIKRLNLAKNTFDIELWDPFQQESAETSTPAKEVLTIDIDLSSYANARRYHDKRKFAATKEDKTIKSSEKAFKSARFKTQTALKEVAVKTSIQKSRKVYWFEKFYWCISSDNYLMIAGRDAQQNELVVKRYMKPGDVYVHGDLHGAASVVIKNNDPTQEIPPRTLEEAATMAICNSSAWEAKIVTRSWWVRPEQVSKTAPSGEYLSVGAFMIRGKKNYLPLTQLILGFGFLFKLDDESAARHQNERSGKKANNASESEATDVEVAMIDGEEDGEDDKRDDEDEDEAFPDTKVRTLSTNSDGIEIEDEFTVVSSAEPRFKKQYLKVTKKTGKNSQKKQQIETTGAVFSDQMAPTEGAFPVQTDISRFQRAKLKKIKKKYQHQDEEDKLIRMAILGKSPATDGNRLRDPDKKKNRRAQKVQALTDTIRTLQTKSSDGKEKAAADFLIPIPDEPEAVERQSGPTTDSVPKNEQNEFYADEDEGTADEQDSDDSDEKGSSGQAVPAHVRLLNSLTGQPTIEDNLLFCIPVVGPYTAMMSYKFKVKVVPGSNRRGKAAKTALHLFTMDRNLSRREKDLLKNAKDLDVSKNLPAKIKITMSASSSQKKH